MNSACTAKDNTEIGKRGKDSVLPDTVTHNKEGMPKLQNFSMKSEGTVPHIRYTNP